MSPRAMKVKVIPASSWTLLPPAPGKCVECAREHDPLLPHDHQSLYYQVKFNLRTGRYPTLDDAMSHCTPEVREDWTRALAKVLTERLENSK